MFIVLLIWSICQLDSVGGIVMGYMTTKIRGGPVLNLEVIEQDGGRFKKWVKYLTVVICLWSLKWYFYCNVKVRTDLSMLCFSQNMRLFQVSMFLSTDWLWE